MNQLSKRSIFIWLSLCLRIFQSAAQCPDTAALNITATLYSLQNGLTSNITIGAAKDKTGFMYFEGVDGKWNRYDGVNFTADSSYILHEEDKYVFYKIPDNPYDKQSIIDYLIRYGNKKEYSMATITRQYLFIAGTGTLLYEVNLDNHEVRKIDLADFIRTDHPSGLEVTMFESYQGYLLIGTANQGLLIYNRCRNTIQHFQYDLQNATNGMTNSVLWILANSENVIWMQTNGGLIKLEVNHQFILTCLPSSIQTGGMCNNCNNIRGIFNWDNDHLLIASLEGVSSFDPGTGKFSYLLSPVDHQPVWNHMPASAITDDRKGNIFISSWANQGILLLNYDEKKLLNILTASDSAYAPFNLLRCLYYDSHHVLWAGTDNGFLSITNLDAFIQNHYSGKVNVSDRFPGKQSNQDVHAGSCFAMAEDSKGNVWMGTNDGLFIYHYDTDDVIRFVHKTNDGSSLSDNEIRSVYISKDDDIWIGTNNGGLDHYVSSSSSFAVFTTENGLPNNSIYTIMEDHHGYLWLGTNGGLCRFNKTDHSVRNYTPRDGIQNLEFNTNAVAMTFDGRFCFGGRTGFNIFNPDLMNVELKPPTVVISKFKIFDKELPVTNETLQLTHEENSLTFDFAALSYYRSSDHQYAYRMVGADKDWIPSGNRTYTSYHNLAPGKYTFKVRAANYSGVWNPKEASMQFIIHPAWYNTWWFRIAMILLLASAIYEFYRYRLRQLMKLQTIRNRIASDLHDEIGSTLSSISLSSTIIQGQLKGSHPEAEKMLLKVSHNTDQMMDALSDIVWAINTHYDRFDNVVNRMRAFAVEMLEPSNTIIQFNVSDDIRDIQLDMQQRKNLYLIFKEAINNIAKYAGCNHVGIDITRQAHKMFLMQIKDNGKGFDSSGMSGDEISLAGNGIRNMKKRATELGGQLIVESALGGGSTVQLRFEIGK